MKLLVDIGNSALKWAQQQDGERAPGRSIQYGKHGISGVLAEAWNALPAPGSVCIASVAAADVDGAVRAYARTHWDLDPHFIQTQAEQCGVRNGYAKPAEMGVDRWLAVIAAWTRYHENCCVVNCGTAITVDGVNGAGHHQGGAIIPGIQLMQSALAQGTARISSAGGGPVPDQPGRSTAQCVQLGTVIAAAAFVDRMAREFSDRLGGRVRGIISGGDAGLVADHLQTGFEHDPDLVLSGLALAVENMP
jgi:type III pantothenate kinase